MNSELWKPCEWAPYCEYTEYKVRSKQTGVICFGDVCKLVIIEENTKK